MGKNIKRAGKPDNSVNDCGLDTAIERYKQKEKTLFPLRINQQTVIYVLKSKCNEQYRQEYLKKMKRL